MGSHYIPGIVLVAVAIFVFTGAGNNEIQEANRYVQVTADKEGRMKMMFCDSISYVHDLLPKPYNKHPGIRAAVVRLTRKCINPGVGSLILVTDVIWDVRKDGIEKDSWPRDYPLLMRVHTEDGKSWWVRKDELRNYTRK